MKSVYLAGPIAGLSYDESTDWRQEAIKYLASKGITCLDPMRSKEHLAGVARIEGSYEDEALSSQKGINTRDHWDVMRCDVVLANLEHAREYPDRPTIGTIMEIAWAWAYRKPLVLILKEDSIYEHPMVLECAGFRVGSLESGLNVVAGLLVTEALPERALVPPRASPRARS